MNERFVADYSRAQRIAYDVLVKYSDGTFPIDPFGIVRKQKNIILKTYTELAQDLQKKNPKLSIEEIKCQFESDRGFLKKKGKKKYILAYNENDPEQVIRWTIFHELGHYFLEHLKRDKLEYLNSYGYDFNVDSLNEYEANCFARHCSCPFPIIYKLCSLHYRVSVSKLFNVSESVSQYVLQHYHYYNEYYEPKCYPNLISKFRDSIINLTKE